ncbi:hypothetical protein GN244_ATG04665 [Phytophthora infestans]|uniref:Uncharacterized protein n=1 Tax=Phytophthora infestans TaxID=4787 RepID=A0A833SZW4_PHYIN|nr:hypothetical protein GN244_ATG04665 [Phytophthora infestans]
MEQLKAQRNVIVAWLEQGDHFLLATAFSSLSGAQGAAARSGITATRDGDAQGFHTDGVVLQRVNIRAEIIQRMILTGASVETISERLTLLYNR